MECPKCKGFFKMIDDTTIMTDTVYDAERKCQDCGYTISVVGDISHLYTFGRFMKKGAKEKRIGA